MGKRSIFYTAIGLLLFFNQIAAQVQTLDHIGQTPGGAAHHVHWIGGRNLLITGCGGSLWVYDMTNPEKPVIIKKRAFKQLINHTDLYGNILFAAATNEGIYALNFSSDSLDIIANYKPDGLWDRDVFDFFRNNDTLYIPDKYEVKVVRFYAGSFEHIKEHTNQIRIGDIDFLKAGARTIDFNEKYMAIGKIKDPVNIGRVSIYNRSYPYQRLAYWENSTLNNIQKVRFADLRDDILYVCAGSTNAGLSSHFYACQYDGLGISPIDTFSIEGLPIFAAANIKNMTSRNDTVYLATTCWLDPDHAIPGSPFSVIPVIDASKLPEQPMSYDTYFYAGLWHFDVELMKGTPFLAIASEWAGLIITNISNPDKHLDTLSVLETGGWVQQVKLKGDTVYVAQEGWGLAAYKSDSLLFRNGYDTDALLLHEYSLNTGHYFVSGFEFMDDTLLYMTNGRVLNMQPWQNGGEPELINTIDFKVPATDIKKISSNIGHRLVLGSGIWPVTDFKISLHNPQTGALLDEVITKNEPGAFAIKDSILFYAYRTMPYLQAGEVHLVAAKTINDQFVTICDFTVKTGTFDVLSGIAVENQIVVVGCGASFLWYEWTNHDFVQIGKYTHVNLSMGTAGVAIKNNLIYGNYRYDGLKVIDLAGNELANFKGSGGYDKMAGSGGAGVVVDDHGRIYIPDFYSGLLIAEAYDLTLNNQENYIDHPIDNEFFSAFPNPAMDRFTIDFCDECDSNNKILKIYDITGKAIFSKNIYDKNSIDVDSRGWKPGLYFISIMDTHHIIKTERILIKQGI